MRKLTKEQIFWITTILGFLPVSFAYFQSVGIVDESVAKAVNDVVLALLGLSIFAPTRPNTYI